MSEYVDTTEELVDSLPVYFQNAEDSGNWHLFAPVADELEDLNEDIDRVYRSIHVQTAQTVAELEALGRMVNMFPRDGESLDHYRARVFARYQLNTSEGTIGDVLTGVASIIGTSVENIGYQDWYLLYGESGIIGVTIPTNSLTNLELTAGEVADIIELLVAAGYNVQAQTQGTFIYVTPETYNSTDWTGYKRGYDSLDTNGNPEGEGGTYAGLLR